MGNFDGSSATRGAADGTRVVSCDLTFVISEPADVVLQVVAASSAGRLLDERFEVTSDVAPPLVAEVAGPHGSRVHLVRAGRGRLAVAYRSEIVPNPLHSPTASASDAGPSFERQVYLRPSRYCPSDHLVGFAVSEFGTAGDGAARVVRIVEWIHRRIGYVPGSSSVHDSAEDTLLTGMGTCRDFAHLGIALCRATGIPARFAAVYAPGLSPMDFHAVFEAYCDDRWCVHDATRLAPRPSLVRIATGRDAADTAFADITSGGAELETIDVSATVRSTSLPEDDAHVMAHLD